MNVVDDDTVDRKVAQSKRELLPDRVHDIVGGACAGRRGSVKEDGTLWIEEFLY